MLGRSLSRSLISPRKQRLHTSILFLSRALPTHRKTANERSGRKVSLEQFLDRDRQISHPNAGSVINSISNCRRYSGYCDLAYSARADRADIRVGYVEECNVDFGNVGIDR